MMHGKGDTDWLAYVLNCTPETTVMRESDLNSLNRDVGSGMDVWLYGERITDKYIEYRNKVWKNILDGNLLDKDERRKNSLLMQAFDTIEDEDQLI